jgi:ACS family hexuronate transporter-like MFS transporter
MTQQTIGKYRWTICALVFMATTINYLDRTVISFLKPYFASSFGWNPAQEAAHYADMEMAFKLAYSFGFLIAGRIIDKLGRKSISNGNI